MVIKLTLVIHYLASKHEFTDVDTGNKIEFVMINCFVSGFTGSLCEYEYNECESSPCTHGGTCTDRINGYSCACTRGYAGKRCEIKVMIKLSLLSFFHY